MCCSLITQCIVLFVAGTFPIDLAKTRLQVQGQVGDSKYREIRYRGMLHAIARVGKEEGLLALYSGSVWWICDSCTVSVYIPSYVLNYNNTTLQISSKMLTVPLSCTLPIHAKIADLLLFPAVPLSKDGCICLSLFYYCLSVLCLWEIFFKVLFWGL